MTSNKIIKSLNKGEFWVNHLLISATVFSDRAGRWALLSAYWTLEIHQWNSHNNSTPAQRSSVIWPRHKAGKYRTQISVYISIYMNSKKVFLTLSGTYFSKFLLLQIRWYFRRRKASKTASYILKMFTYPNPWDRSRSG